MVELPLFDEPFYVACPAGRRLARAEAIALAELERESMYLADGPCLRDRALAICRGAANAHGGAGLGLALLPALAIR